MTSARVTAQREAARAAAVERIVAAAEAAMAAAASSVEVAELAIALVDEVKPIVPIGGGMVLPGRARPYAEAVIEALARFPKHDLQVAG